MTRFEADRYYRPNDPELAFLGEPATFANWRHRGTGPQYVRYGNRVLYRGQDLNNWLDSHLVTPGELPGEPRDAVEGAAA